MTARLSSVSSLHLSITFCFTYFLFLFLLPLIHFHSLGIALSNPGWANFIIFSGQIVFALETKTKSATCTIFKLLANIFQLRRIIIVHAQK